MLQASTQLARNVELRLHGCSLLARVKPVVLEGGEVGRKENVALNLKNVEQICSKFGRPPPVRQPSIQISYSLVEEHKVRSVSQLTILNIIMQASITVGVIMGVFLLCWSPFFMGNIVHGLCKECVAPGLFKVLTWLGYSNSAFNPVIYSIFNR